MFDALGEKLTAVFQRLGGKGRLTEKDIDEALKEVRVALLEADVNFRVARDFVAKVKARCLDAGMLLGLNPGQQVVKVVNEELTAILSAGDHRLHHGTSATATLMLVGLQGSGKTTTAAKLATHLAASGRGKPMLVAADLRRPAAVDQLVALGKQLGYARLPGIANVFVHGGARSPETVPRRRRVRTARGQSSTPVAGCRSTTSSWRSLPRSRRPSTLRKSSSWSTP